MYMIEKYNKKHKLDDLLFIVGSIAPDCWRNSKLFGYENRYLSHFTNTQLNNENEDYQMFFLKYQNLRFYVYALTLKNYVLTSKNPTLE